MDTVISKLKSLRLKNCALNLSDIIDQGIRNNLSALQTIDRLLDSEINCREEVQTVPAYGKNNH